MTDDDARILAALKQISTQLELILVKLERLTREPR